MTNKPDKNRPRDGILKEAWDHMREDLSRILPAPLLEKFGQGRRSWHLMLLITILELVVLGVVGKFIYDWLVS